MMSHLGSSMRDQHSQCGFLLFMAIQHTSRKTLEGVNVYIVDWQRNGFSGHSNIIYLIVYCQFVKVHSAKTNSIWCNSYSINVTFMKAIMFSYCWNCVREVFIQLLRMLIIELNYAILGGLGWSHWHKMGETHTGVFTYSQYVNTASVCCPTLLNSPVASVAVMSTLCPRMRLRHSRCPRVAAKWNLEDEKRDGENVSSDWTSGQEMVRSRKGQVKKG